MEPKTPKGKPVAGRKSTPWPNKFKQGKNSPKNSPKSPFNGGKSPKVNGTPQNNSPNKSFQNKKRRSSVTDENEKSPFKKQKMVMFTGTSNLEGVGNAKKVVKSENETPKSNQKKQAVENGSPKKTQPEKQVPVKQENETPTKKKKAANLGGVENTKRVIKSENETPKSNQKKQAVVNSSPKKTQPETQLPVKQENETQPKKKKAKKQKQPKSLEVVESESTKPKTESKANQGDKATGSRKQRNHEKLKLKRQQARQYSKNLQQAIQSGKMEEEKVDISDIAAKIRDIQSRPKITKSGHRKLKLLIKLQKMAAGQTDDKSTKPEVSRAARKKERKLEKRLAKKALNEKAAEKVQEQPKEPIKVQEKPASSEENSNESDSDDEAPENLSLQEEQDDDNSSESDYDVESTIKVNKVTKKMNEAAKDSDEDGIQEDSDDEDGNEEADNDASSDDEVEEESTPINKNKKQSKKDMLEEKTKILSEVFKKDQKRFVLFVGNLPYDVNKDEIKSHFEKAGQVKHIRIPLEKSTNKPRGFAYVELHNEKEYEKGLSLHNTFIKGRRINVQYTQGGKKQGEEKKKESKIKNFKLDAMRRKGMLEGSMNESQRRAARRAKRKNLQRKPENSE